MLYINVIYNVNLYTYIIMYMLHKICICYYIYIKYMHIIVFNFIHIGIQCEKYLS